MRKLIYYLLIMATLAVAIIFASLNYPDVPVKYLFGETKISLSKLLYSTFLLGVIFGVALEGVLLMRQRSRIRKLQKDKAAVETELNNLRKQPIEDLR